MSQTTITLAFEQWKAQQGATGEPVLLDEFVFANVPGLDPDQPVDRNETLPPAEQIVHRQAVSRKGVVNDNAVVHSVVLGADVGDFSFNWIGLLNKASGTLAMIVHAPLQQKLKTAEGQQGNVLTRSFLMEYNGAQAETGINTPAETWQIDFTARMAGMDERQRLENIDIFGAAAFFGDGYLVGKSGNQFYVTKGTGYVAGLRTTLAENLNITVTTRPVKVWLDVCWTGTLTSVWGVQSRITVADNLADYVQNGVQHYVFAVAGIDENGNITDLRPKGTLNEQQASDALRKHEQSRNHPDATTREKGFVQLSSDTNSESESLAATPKAVKAAMDNANGRLAKNSNGGDIPDKGLFAQNISAALAFSGGVTIGGDDNPWTTAEFIAWLESCGAFNHPYWMCKGSWDYAGNKVITDTGCGNICLAGAVIEMMGTRGEMTIRVTTPTTTSGGGIASAQFTYINHGEGYAPGWRREFSRTGDEMTGNLYLKNDGRVNFCIMNEDGTPRMWLFKDKGGDGVHINNGNDGGGDFIFGKDGSFYASAVRAGIGKKLSLTSNNNSTMTATFNLWGDANRPTVIELDDDQGWHLYSQRNPDGSIVFTVNGDITANTLRAGGAIYQNNGDIFGSVWGNSWLSTWIHNNVVRAVRLGPVALSGGLWRDFQLGGGQVVTGFHTDGSWEMEGGDDKVYYRPIQYLVGDTWVTAPSV
ncbi:phage tail protein [Salmonella enterica subsp. enterica]|uniref:phage tail-collar fiber domain-containing protein n=1 Tax=Salmonella enterica TaxID=28901 RepID=UPI00107A202D|nr:phage tail protein [Salmonella enterica subsp. enterica serovar Heidelberg]EBH3319062.1 phage tail protein [Salmonella enterica subsp. enterica serovar Aberdeen]EBP9992673.1 phage tail protein [Salmonella enterica subsp. enterica]ECE7567234.1 phage tail protein [Salmonella enterica subsp. enterica serovar Kinondoni]ELS9673346.1 phage tail protein [Salmonella enterica]